MSLLRAATVALFILGFAGLIAFSVATVHCAADYPGQTIASVMLQYGCLPR
jgi:hypothetical protein